jgi:hypothetical protein
MGQEIFYCSRCRRRLTTAEFEKGLGVRIGSQVACTDCLPEVVGSFTAQEQRDFAKEIAALKKTPPRESRRSSTAHIPIPRPKPGSSFASRHPKSGPLLLTIAGVTVVVVLGIVLLAPRGRSSPPVAPPPPPPVQEDAATRAAREAVDRARKTRGELETQIAVWAQAARAAEGTRFHKEALETHQALLEQRKSTQGREAAEVEAQAQPLLDREEFGAAAEHFERARSRHEQPEWKSLMDAKGRVVRARAEALFSDLLPRAVEARRGGKESEVASARDRLGRWKLPDLSAEFDRRLAAVAPTERPWKPVFDGKTLEFLQRSSRSGWEVRDGALVPAVSNAGQTTAEFGDGEVRIRFEAKEVNVVYFMIRKAGSEGTVAKWNTSAFRPYEGKPCELLFTCRGDSVTASLNGQSVPVEATGSPRKGILQFNAQAKLFRILSIESRE